MNVMNGLERFAVKKLHFVSADAVDKNGGNYNFQ